MTLIAIKFLYTHTCTCTSPGTDVASQKNIICGYLQAIESKLRITEDMSTLDRVLSLLMQASASLDITSDCNETMAPFEVKDKLAPTQKNETQLRLWKTARTPGRKCNKTALRYM